jgi:hypothetical protein
MTSSPALKRHTKLQYIYSTVFLHKVLIRYKDSVEAPDKAPSGARLPYQVQYRYYVVYS